MRVVDAPHTGGAHRGADGGLALICGDLPVQRHDAVVDLHGGAANAGLVEPLPDRVLHRAIIGVERDVVGTRHLHRALDDEPVVDAEDAVDRARRFRDPRLLLLAVHDPLERDDSLFGRDVDLRGRRRLLRQPILHARFDRAVATRACCDERSGQRQSGYFGSHGCLLRTEAKQRRGHGTSFAPLETTEEPHAG
jgi:hypothetical protein